MAGVLPGLGRNGIINSVRKLSGYDVPGWKEVDESAVFMAGQVATLVADSNGNPVLTTMSGTLKPIGIFFCHKAVSFYHVIVNEVVTVPAIGADIPLKHAGLKANSYKALVCNSAGTSTGAAYTLTTNYTINDTNGLFHNVNINVSSPVYVALSYLYADATMAGIDQTLGSGKASYLSDPCEIATLVYDTASATPYTLGAAVYSSTTGYITATSNGTQIGTVTKIPTASDPELYVRIRIA
jgi:hypothetical protein